jgi:hypothetical protein
LAAADLGGADWERDLVAAAIACWFQPFAFSSEFWSARVVRSIPSGDNYEQDEYTD